MRKIILFASSFFVLTIYAKEPVYNFNFYNNSNKNKVSVQKESNSKLKNINVLQNERREEKGHQLSSAYLGIGSYPESVLGSVSLEGGIYKQKFSNLFLLYGLNYERLFVEYWGSPYEYAESGVEGGSYCIELLSGVYHGSDIRKSSFFGIFHELNYGFGYFRGRYSDREDNLDSTFSSITYMASYEAGVKINLALFWLGAGYEFKYINNFVGDDLPDFAYQKLEKRINIKIELPL